MANIGSGEHSDTGGGQGGGRGGSTRRPSSGARRPVLDREVHTDWTDYPRYMADRGPATQGEPSLHCADCGQSAFELFHGRCMPCAIRAEIPLRQRDREAYAARVKAGMAAPAIRHVPPTPPSRVRWWQWRRWWPWARRRRATDRTPGA